VLYNTGNTLIASEQYSYELDADGYVSKQKVNNVLKGKLYSKNFTRQ
jgi:hypothetical protein